MNLIKWICLDEFDKGNLKKQIWLRIWWSVFNKIDLIKSPICHSDLQFISCLINQNWSFKHFYDSNFYKTWHHLIYVFIMTVHCTAKLFLAFQNFSCNYRNIFSKIEEKSKRFMIFFFKFKFVEFRNCNGKFEKPKQKDQIVSFYVTYSTQIYWHLRISIFAACFRLAITLHTITLQ